MNRRNAHQRLTATVQALQVACGAAVNFLYLAAPGIPSSSVTATVARPAFSAIGHLATTALAWTAQTRAEGGIHFISVNLASQMYLCPTRFEYGKFSSCPRSYIAISRCSHLSLLQKVFITARPSQLLGNRDFPLEIA